MDQLNEIRRLAHQRWAGENQRTEDQAPAGRRTPPAPARRAPTPPQAAAAAGPPLPVQRAPTPPQQPAGAFYGVRAPDEDWTGRLADGFEVDESETGRMLREIQEQMAAHVGPLGGADPFFPQLGGDAFRGDIEAEIDERLAAEGWVEGENMLQIMDAQGRNIIAGGWAGEQVFDVGTDGPNEGNDPVVFEMFSIRSILRGAQHLPADDRHCAICQDVLAESEDVRRLNCCHIFHVDCIDRWLTRCLRCPVCKHQFHPHTDRLVDPMLHGKEADLVECF